MNIRESDLRGVDLNLLVTFLVLMRERSVSRAAERLHLGQPAVSGALARLRELLGDELLVRTAQGMQPTVRAQLLQQQIAPALEHLQTALFEPAGFDPATDARTFTLGMPDWIELWLMPRLFARLQQVAPKVRIAIKASDPFSGTAMLEREEIDLSIGSARDAPAWLRTQPLRTMQFHCIYNRKLVPTGPAISLAEYTQATHLLVTYRTAFFGVVDEKLAELGLQRDVCYSTPHFSTLPGILASTPAVATVPAVLAERWRDEAGLHLSPVPIPLPDFTIKAIWHATRDQDPALRWLLAVVEDVVTTCTRQAAQKTARQLEKSA
ncbi:LysR family transcriptional regulator [Chitinimonas sp.]|uniref:LysR family transcriptional regulator n=1 Tax=Chitinimonas sp. TaxID=1934313 RepID=UPI002F93EF74